MPIENSAPKANSAFVPVEGSVPAAVNHGGDARAVNAGKNPYGGNNEQLPERLQAALRRLVQQYSVGIDAAAGSAADQAGAPVLARAAIFVVERAGSELAFAF
jgi:hypothetical protein